MIAYALLCGKIRLVAYSLIFPDNQVIIYIYKIIFFLSVFYNFAKLLPMGKGFIFFIMLLYGISDVYADTAGRASQYIHADTYNRMYPYMTNKMRTELNPGTQALPSNDIINTVVKTTENTNSTRRVVPRGTPNRQSGTARVATTSAPSPNVSTSARVAVRNDVSGSNRRVVQRRTTRAANTTNVRQQNTTKTNTTNAKNITSSRCLADYTECMNGYCQRENTAYNRCYCSSKLAQIDSKYQNNIDSLIQQILTLQNSGTWSQSEMNEYWMSVIGNYDNENAWVKLDDALNINWESTASRVRGQNAFLTGHEYCSQHLSACFYMADNLRDAYISEISRDCQTYETSLQTLQNVAESVIKSYNE